jgi:hypothetical protein
LALALALGATAGAARAAAQTVIVRSAPMGATAEAVPTGLTPITAAVDSFGDATLTLPARTGDTDVLVHVDVCDAVVRVHLTTRGAQPPAPAPGCNRSDAGSVFRMRSTTTFVIDIDDRNATVHVAQGAVPPAWIYRGTGNAPSPSTWGTPVKGFVVSAAVGLSNLSDTSTRECGDVTACKKTDTAGAVAVGAEYWILNYLAAHVSYVRPGDVKVAGSGNGFRFDSLLQTRVVTVGAKAGTAIGPTRIYAVGGMNHHEATLTRTQTAGTLTQAFGQQSKGWSWTLGGGVEGWINRWLAVYAEASRVKIKGKPTDSGEGGVTDQAMLVWAGVRLGIGK